MMRYYIVDAFTDQPFSGNPAGIVLLGEEAFPSERLMTQVAAELRYSETAFVRLNEFGRRVYQLLCGLPQFYAGKGYALKVLAARVMPDHIHLVIQVLEPLPQSIGAVVRGFKSACTKIYKQDYYGSGENAAEVHGQGGERQVDGGSGENAAEMQGQGGGSGENAAEMHGRGGGRQGEGGRQGDGVLVHFARIFVSRGSIWQQDPAHYHERILHAPGQLRRMIDYVKDNPRRGWLKARHPDLFRLHRHTAARGLLFTSLGNHFLLEWPDRQMVEMSRSASATQVEQRLAEVLAAAQNGAVTYTAAISEGEQLIARRVREGGFPLVVLLNDGFPKPGTPHERYYKPGGVYFEACSRGQLLLLEPDEQMFLDASIQAAVEQTLRRKAWLRHFSYTPIPPTSRRYRFIALNEMAKLLSQDE